MYWSKSRILKVMPTKKIVLFVAVLVIIAAAVLSVVYFLPKEDVSVDYPLPSVQDGTYSGELPPLDYEVQFSQNTDEAVRAAIRVKVAELQEKLAETPYDGNLWMELALRYHTANDYQAALQVWEFIVSVTPNNVTALGNLGRLHHFDLKNFETAEGYFKKAIEANPARPEAYYELFDLYRYSYKKDTTAAVDIMKQAGEQFPEDYGIPAGIATYYREKGQRALARTYFEQALVLARNQGNLSAVQSITNELANLP